MIVTPPFVATIEEYTLTRQLHRVCGVRQYNHRNGEWYNADSENDGQFHETRAWRTIEPGEQIFLSYNRCSRCGGRTSGYGSAGMSGFYSGRNLSRHL